MKRLLCTIFIVLTLACSNNEPRHVEPEETKKTTYTCGYCGADFNDQGVRDQHHRKHRRDGDRMK